jgi:hypothetical protein
MRCFRCAQEIVVPPKDDPIYDTIPAGQDRNYYFPATVLEVLPDNDVGNQDCHCTVVCWACFHEIDPDMWIENQHWTALNPAVPADQLPVLDHDNDHADEIETYASYAPKRKET